MRLDVDGDDNLMWQQMNKGTLVINHPGQQDAGMYQCFAYNAHGTATTHKVNMMAASKFYVLYGWTVSRGAFCVAPRRAFL